MTIAPDFEELLSFQHQVNAIPNLMHTRNVNSQLAGLYSSAFCGQGMDFQEARVYQEGDDVRHIDWRITARTGVPHIKLFEEQRERSVLFCIDTSAYMAFGTRQTFKSVQAARAVAILGWSANQHQDRVGGLLFGQQTLRYFRPKKGGQAFLQLLKALSHATTNEPANDDSLLNALDKLTTTAQTGALIFIIGDFNRDNTLLKSKLSHLKQRHEVVIIAVDDPSDWALPNMGAVLFADHLGHVYEINTNNANGQQRYQALWQSQRQQLKKMLDSLNIPMLAVMTNQDIYQTLVKELQYLVHRQVVR